MEYKCKGFYSHSVCIFSVGDLQFLSKENDFFVVNKFYLDYDPITYQCIEELYTDRAKNQIQIVDVKTYCDLIKKISSSPKCNFH